MVPLAMYNWILAAFWDINEIISVPQIAKQLAETMTTVKGSRMSTISMVDA